MGGGGEREGGVGRKKGFSFSELARRPAQLPSLEGGGHPQPRNYARNATGGRRNIGPFAGYVGCGAGERSEAGRLHAVDLGGGIFSPLAAAASTHPNPNPNGQASICTTELRAELRAGQEKGVRGRGVFASYAAK